MQTAELRSRLAFCFITTCVLAVMAAAVAEAEQPKLPETVVPPADLKLASEANGKFAVDVYQRLAEAESGKSIFLSPFSISLALTMVAEGAVDETLDQMTVAMLLPW